MNAVIALAIKDLKLLGRDKFALFWIFAFPLMFALFFGAIFKDGGSGGGALALALVDEDRSDSSRRLIGELAENPSLRLERLAVAEGAAEESGELELIALADAREAVQKGRRAAYLRIPTGYGENPYALFGAGEGDEPQIEIGIDPGRRAEAGFLQGILMEATFGALQQRILDPEVLRGDLAEARAEVAESTGLPAGQKLVLQGFLGALDVFVAQFDMQQIGGPGADGEGGGMAAPFTVVDVTRQREDQPRSTFDVTFPQALVWGLMSVALGFAITLVRERSSGTLARLRIAPITYAQLLGGKALGCFVGCLGTMLVLLVFGALALGIRFDSLPLLALALGSTAACFTGLMMTISVMGKTEQAVAGSSWGLLMPFAMLGGGMIPLIAMPSWLVTASAISPFRWAIQSIEGAVWRGFDLGDMLLPCGVLLATGAAFFALGVWIFTRTEN